VEGRDGVLHVLWHAATKQGEGCAACHAAAPPCHQLLELHSNPGIQAARTRPIWGSSGSSSTSSACSILIVVAAGLATHAHRGTASGSMHAQ